MKQNSNFHSLCYFFKDSLLSLITWYDLISSHRETKASFRYVQLILQHLAAQGKQDSA